MLVADLENSQEEEDVKTNLQVEEKSGSATMTLSQEKGKKDCENESTVAEDVSQKKDVLSEHKSDGAKIRVNGVEENTDDSVKNGVDESEGSEITTVNEKCKPKEETKEGILMKKEEQGENVLMKDVAENGDVTNEIAVSIRENPQPTSNLKEFNETFVLPLNNAIQDSGSMVCETEKAPNGKTQQNSSEVPVDKSEDVIGLEPPRPDANQNIALVLSEQHLSIKAPDPATTLEKELVIKSEEHQKQQQQQQHKVVDNTAQGSSSSSTSSDLVVQSSEQQSDAKTPEASRREQCKESQSSHDSVSIVVNSNHDGENDVDDLATTIDGMIEEDVADQMTNSAESTTQLTATVPTTDEDVMKTSAESQNSEETDNDLVENFNRNEQHNMAVQQTVESNEAAEEEDKMVQSFHLENDGNANL